LKAIEPELPFNKFLRIHKSFIVTIAEITAIRKNSVFIKDMELPASETFKEGIEKLINEENLKIQFIGTIFLFFLYCQNRKNPQHRLTI
jgi:hypothetical protein